MFGENTIGTLELASVMACFSVAVSPVEHKTWAAPARLTAPSETCGMWNLDHHARMKQWFQLIGTEDIDSFDTGLLSNEGGIGVFNGPDNPQGSGSCPDLLRACLEHHLSHAPLGAQDYDFGDTRQAGIA
jgi:hypothetical protein